jgi:hypothetical protein
MEARTDAHVDRLSPFPDTLRDDLEEAKGSPVSSLNASKSVKFSAVNTVQDATGKTSIKPLTTVKSTRFGLKASDAFGKQQTKCQSRKARKLAIPENICI